MSAIRSSMAENTNNCPHEVNRQLSAFRSNAHVDYCLDMLTFKQALRKALDARPDLSIRKVAMGAGVSYDQLRMVLKRDTATTNVEDGVKVAAYFGMELSQFLEIPEEQRPAEIVEVYNQLPEHMRQKIVAYGRGMLDSLDQDNREAQLKSQ